MKVEKVLVPLDGSALSEAALPFAIDLLADSPKATLLLLRAAEATSLPSIDQTEAEVRVVRDAEEYLSAVAERLTRFGVRGVKTSVWYGPAAAAIIDAARLGAIGMIVMSTHGRSGLGRLVLGSVAESVLRGTRTPVLFVRDGAAPLEKRGRPAAPVAAREIDCV